MNNSMPELKVAYEPNPIPWVIHQNHQGKQTEPGRAEVTLTVFAVDADSGEPVAGDVTSNTVDPLGLIDDPNVLSFQTNTPQVVTLLQVTSREVPPHHPPLFISPGVQVTADGYERAFLLLD
jgi:hypothetical protein